LVAQGTAQDSIIFTRNENEGNWSTIFFTETADTTSILKHCRIEFGNSVYWIIDLNHSNFLGSLSFFHSKATIINNTIAYSQGHIGGAGIYSGENSRPDIIYNRIEKNSYSGIYCEKYSNPNIQANHIVANYDRGILCVDSSSAMISNNQIADNDFVGISCRNSSPIITNNSIINNHWGIECKLKSTSKIINNLIKVNSIGIFCWENSSPWIINNTIVENSNGIFVQTHSNPHIVNSIIWENKEYAIAIGVNDNATSYPTISYSIVQDENPHEQIRDLGYNFLNKNPLFTTDSYYLQDSSLGVNAGTPDVDDLDLPELDLAGNPRIIGERVDIGAYENQNQLVGIFDYQSKRNIYQTDLLENYPNPFNTVTKIKFSMNIPSQVNLNIYNIRGQLISTLINDKMDSDYHTVIWNGEDNLGNPVPSGIYFCKIHINNHNKMKSILLLK
jgi:parallel beta-helix repeat protein